MNEEVVLLLMLKLLRKARNAAIIGVLFRYLRVCENFISDTEKFLTKRNASELISSKKSVPSFRFCVHGMAH